MINIKNIEREKKKHQTKNNILSAQRFEMGIIMIINSYFSILKREVGREKERMKKMGERENMGREI